MTAVPKVPVLQLGDVLTPLATLVGLLAAALGLIVGARLEPNLLKIIVYIMVLIILFFVATSALAITAAWSRRESIWKLSIGLYVSSWIVFGIGLILMVLGFVYGAQAFVITLPTIGETDILTSAISVVATLAVISDTVKYLREWKKERRS